MSEPKDRKKPYRVPAIRDLRADTPEGHCVFCQEPFVEGWETRARADKVQDVCGAAEVQRDTAAGIENECGKAYHRLLMARTRKEQRELLNLTDTTEARKLLERATKLLARVERRTHMAALAEERG